MLRTLSPGEMHAVYVLYEEHREHCKKKACNLQPQDASRVGKRAQKSTSKCADALLCVAHFIGALPDPGLLISGLLASGWLAFGGNGGLGPAGG